MSAFGTLQSTEAGGQSLTGTIASKISKTRKQAKAKDKKSQPKQSSDDTQSQQTDTADTADTASPTQSQKKNFFGNPFASLKNKLSFNKKGKPASPKNRDIAGGGEKKSPGLIRILTKGFGVLATDTTQIQGNLSQITETLQRQLGIQDYTSNSVTGVQSILSDQLESQSAIIEALGGTVPSKSSGGGGSSSFGSASSTQAGGKSLTAFVAEEIQRKLENLGFAVGGAILPRVLGLIAKAAFTNPWTLTIGGGILAGVIAANAIKDKQPFSKTPIYKDPKKNNAARQQLPPTLGGTSQVRHPSYLPIGDPRRWPYDNPGKPIPPNIQSQIDSMPKAGPWQNFAAGGVNSMIGEAGKERVVQLNSREGNRIGSGESTAAMQATGGALLSVVDQFIKSQGSNDITQYISPKSAALAKDFDIPGGILNFKAKTGNFKGNNDTKKKRDQFMKNLVEDSLKALGAKTKKPNRVSPGAGPGGPGGSGNPTQRAAAAARANTSMSQLPKGMKTKQVTLKDGTTQTIRQSNAAIFGSKVGYRKEDTNGLLPGGMQSRPVSGPGIQYRPVEGTGGTRWYDIDGYLYSWKKGTAVQELNTDELMDGWNGKPFIRKLDTGHVRVNEDDWTLTGTFQRPPKLGEYSYKFGKIWSKGKDGKEGWMTPGGGTGPFGGKASALPPSNDIKFASGGGILGGVGRFVTGMATPIERMINAVAPVSNRRTTAKGLRGTNLKRIMHGTGEGVPNLIRNNGFRGQMGMLGEGVYGSVKGWVADTYRGAGKFKGVLPGQGPRLDMLVPQGARTLRGATVVSPRQANRGLRIAEGVLSGKYTGPKAQSLLPLLTQQTPTMLQAAQRSGMGLAKLFGKFLGVLNLPVVGDALLPEGTAQYDQLTGPNAYYNAPGYKGPKPGGYENGGGMFGPSWMPWNWGKLVDNQRNVNRGMGYDARHKNVTDPALRSMMGLSSQTRYETGGSAFTTLQSSSNQRRDPEIASIEDALKVLTIKMSSLEQYKPPVPATAAAAPMGVSNQSANGDGGIIINNIMAASAGGGGGGGGASSRNGYRTADTAAPPDASGTAALLNRSPFAVYR